MEASGGLLKRLCCHITGISNIDDRLWDHYQTCVMLLNNDLLGEVARDNSQITDEIKKSLVHEKKIAEAARFSTLVNKLERSNVLRNKPAVLTLFNCLSRRNSRCSSRSDTGSETSVLLGGPNAAGVNGVNSDFFQPPSLQSSGGASSESFASGGSFNFDGNPTRYDTRQNHHGGRVARIVEELHKGVALTAESNVAPLVTSAEYRSKPLHLNFKSSKGNKPEPQTEISEDVLIREIIFALQGIEGRIIKFQSANDSFVIDPMIRLTPGKKDLTMKIIEVGWMYSRVKRFCETHAKNSGLVNQSLVLALREQLNEYCRLIAVLETQLHDTNESSDRLTLRRLLMWTLEPRINVRALCVITNAVKDTRGGASLSVIYKHLQHGDPCDIQVVLHALSQACQPLFVMLTEWLLVGNLQDPHEEFFIMSYNNVSNEKLWHDKYAIRWCKLPSFISKSQAQRILATGKSLNFLRQVCNFKSPISGRDSIKAALQKTTVEAMLKQDESDQLDNLIWLTFRSTSAHVLEEILNRHKLMDHLRALKRYLLMEQGDFINYLMEIIEPQLCQPANRIHPHKLSSLLENAIAASNAHYEDPDIINRLYVRLLECSAGEQGWDVFSLDYHVDGPIGTVFTADCMRQYLMLFNTLWRAKYMEWILSAAWKQQAATSKKCRQMPEMTEVLHRVQILLHEMIHLVRQMSFYMSFEVLECSWHSLLEEVNSSQSLDNIIGAHQKFLDKIIEGTMLDRDSMEVRTHLRSLYGLMQKLKNLQEKIYSSVIKELEARETYAEFKRKRTAAGEFATTQTLELQESERRKEFSVVEVSAIRTELNILAGSYEHLIHVFLLLLAQHKDETLNLLSSRLDFNGYYHKKDDKLNSRLTFFHLRKSILPNSLNSSFI